ncbi:hypothetical protein [Streptomyces zagrosensis]|uniref:Uncharacterized protein n=1 Tax=Streptomyces zagrosensis TaxID=1042984 RepID=A0A7W9V047_9ACTN|nr:hypothetical protein [Streptomyces zagrosensis]MBB5936419.1 hypothetical protein [Streptomyces zagrosensis]
MGALGEGEFASDVAGVVSLGDQAQDLALGCGESGEVQSVRAQHFPLEAADLAEEVAQQVGGNVALSLRHGRDDLQQALGSRFSAPDDADELALSGADELLLVGTGGHQHPVRCAGALDVSQQAQHFVVYEVHDHDGHLGIFGAVRIDDPYLWSRTELAGHAGLGDRVLDAQHDGCALWVVWCLT